MKRHLWKQRRRIEAEGKLFKDSENVRLLAVQKSFKKSILFVFFFNRENLIVQIPKIIEHAVSGV